MFSGYRKRENIIEDAFERRITWGTTAAMAILCLITSEIGLLFSLRSDPRTTIYALAGMVFLTALGLIQAGYVKHGKAITVAAMLILITVILVSTGGFSMKAPVFIIGPVLIAGIMGTRWGLFVVALYIPLSIFIYYLETSTNLLPEPPTESIHIIIIGQFLTIATLMSVIEVRWHSVRNTKRTLTRQVDKQTEEHRVLVEITNIISRNMGLEETVANILACAYGNARDTNSCILYSDPSNNKSTLSLCHYNGTHTASQQVESKLMPIYAQVQSDQDFLKNGYTILSTQDPNLKPEYRAFLEQNSKTHITVLALKGLSTFKGILMYGDTRTDHRLDLHEIQLMRIICNQLELVIQSKQLIEKLSTNEKRLQDVLDTQQEMICRYDEETLLVTFANAAFREHIGLDEKAIPGKKINELLTLPDEIALINQASQSSNADNTIEIQCNDNQIDSTWIKWTAQPVAGINEMQIEGVNITTMKRAQKSLDQALEQERQLNTLKSNFITTASHEFRTPITVIQASVDSLIRYSDRMNDQKREHRLQKIYHQTRHMKMMLDDIITLDKIQSDETDIAPVMLNLIDIINKTVEDISVASKPIKHRVVLNSSTPVMLNADINLITQITKKLISNAITYSPETEPVHIDVMTTGDHVVMKVTDYGASRKSIRKTYLTPLTAPPIPVSPKASDWGWR